jgi:MFS family permease
MGWRWSFLIQAPLVLVAALLAWVMIPGPKEPKESEREGEEADVKPKRSKIARIDFAGAILLALTVTSLLLAVELAGQQKVAVMHAAILGLLASFLGFGVLFVLTEVYWAAEPVFPVHLLKRRDVMSAYLVLALQISAQLAVRFKSF